MTLRQTVAPTAARRPRAAVRVAADANAEVQLLARGDIAGWCAVTDPDGIPAVKSVTVACPDIQLAPTATARLAAWHITADAITVYGKTASIDTTVSPLGPSSKAGQREVAAVREPDGHWALSAAYLEDFGIFQS